jgi:type II secretory pathway pseudopilin PulG
MNSRWRERGDTLVEVTIALAILSAVILSAFVVANRAYFVGRNANEKERDVAYAQLQAEALTSFRDSHTWDEFLNGGTDANGSFKGINVAFQPTGNCTSANVYCFHMEQTAPNKPWYPRWGPKRTPVIANAVGLSSVTINIGQTPIPSSATSVDFILFYLNDRAGADKVQCGNNTKCYRNTGHINLTLSDIEGLRQP